jgi:hypothetical protein
MIAALILAPVLLEVGLGVASTGRQDIPVAPTLSVRAARQSEHWSVGGRALVLAGPEGQDYLEHPGPNAGGFRGWALLAEAEAHGSGPIQASIRGAAGAGQIIRISASPSMNPEQDVLDGLFGPVLSAAAGVRFEAAPRFFLGLEAGLTAFTRVKYIPNPIWQNPPNPSPFVGAAHLLASFGFLL